MEKTIEELEKEIELLDKEDHKLMKETKDYYDYYQKAQPIWNKMNALRQEVTKLKPKEDIKMRTIDDYGDHMTLESFIESCKSGDFIDDDGFGLYASKISQTTDLYIYPSDVLSGNYRTDFTHVVWYNK